MLKLPVRRRLVLSNCLLLCAALVFVTSNASALQTLSTDQMVPDFSSVLTFDQYNGSETLAGVKITIEVIGDDAQFGFDNDRQAATTVVVDLDITGSISSTDVSLPTVNPAIAMFDHTSNLAADNDVGRGFSFLPDVDSELYSTGIFSATSSAVTTTALAAYQGSGTFDIAVYLDQLLVITADSGVSISSLPVLAEANITVEYLVPEPVSIALLGFGGLMISRRRRCEK
jgi:hypothetical protein